MNLELLFISHNQQNYKIHLEYFTLPDESIWVLLSEMTNQNIILNYNILFFFRDVPVRQT